MRRRKRSIWLKAEMVDVEVPEPQTGAAKPPSPRSHLQANSLAVPAYTSRGPLTRYVDIYIGTYVHTYVLAL